MKTIIATALAFILTLSANAQSQATYYSPVNETVELGFGFNPQSHKFIISIIEESKDDVDFDLSITTPFGNIMEKTFADGDITIIPKSRKVSYYECNYELTPMEMSQLMFFATHKATISINGIEMNSQDFLNALHGTMK